MSMRINTNLFPNSKKVQKELDRAIKDFNNYHYGLSMRYGKKLPAFLYNKSLFEGMPIEECVRLTLKKKLPYIKLTIQILEGMNTEKSKELIKHIKEEETVRIRLMFHE